MAKIDTSVRPFSGKDEWGYIFGDMAGSFVNLYVDAYFLAFCTYCLGIDAGFMFGLFLVARIWDAINDPLIGSLPDRWHLGKSLDKFTPWIKLFMIPLAISGILCFSKLPLEGVALHAFVCFAYIFFGMSYTGTSMPFGAMANVVTQDPVQRSKLSRARSVGGGLVGAVALGMVPVLCYNEENQPIAERFTMLAVIFGICSVICYILLCTLTKERVREDRSQNEKFEFFKVLKMVLKNRPLIGVMIAIIGSMLVITGSSQTYGYIYKEVYGNAKLATAAMAFSMPFMIVVFPLIPKMVNKFGKRDVILYTAALSFVFSVVRLFIYIENVWVYTALNIMTLLGQTAFTMLIWALVSDCLDYSEWKTGFRSDGSMYSMYTFSRKIGSAIASAGLAGSLKLVGYVSGENVVQTAEAVKGIYYICNAIPTICYGLILLGIGLIFNLDKKKTDQMYAEMAAKRAAK